MNWGWGVERDLSDPLLELNAPSKLVILHVRLRLCPLENFPF